jgi:trimethyllysine dioxygenase
MNLEIIVKIDDEKSLTLDLFWLRDHCRCESCYDHSNHQRKINILEIPDDISTESYEVTNQKLQVICEFEILKES